MPSPTSIARIATVPDITANGVRFTVRELGNGNPLILLHGFTGSSQSWWPVLDRFADGHRLIAIDLIGHGQSEAPPNPERYEFERALADLAEIAGQLEAVPATWLGYSMGGRLALGVALRYPALVSRLIVESASPGIDDATERAARRQADAALASRIDREGIEAFVEAWEALPLWSSQHNVAHSALLRQREIRLANRPLGLANSLRGMGQGSQPSLWNGLARLEAPTLLIAGELDNKFAGIASRMAARLPNTTLAIVPGAGHAVHLERPDDYVATVDTFLSRNSFQAMTAGNTGEENVA